MNLDNGGSKLALKHPCDLITLERSINIAGGECSNTKLSDKIQISRELHPAPKNSAECGDSVEMAGAFIASAGIKNELSDVLQPLKADNKRAKLNANQRAYYYRHRAKCLEYAKVYRLSHELEVRERVASWTQRNKERVGEYHKAWYQKNRERLLAAAKERRRQKIEEK